MNTDTAVESIDTSQGTPDNGAAAPAEPAGSAPSAAVEGGGGSETPSAPSPPDQLAVLEDLIEGYDAQAVAYAEHAKQRVAEGLEMSLDQVVELEAEVQRLEEVKARAAHKRRELEQRVADLLRRKMVTLGTLRRLGLMPAPPVAPAAPQALPTTVVPAVAMPASPTRKPLSPAEIAAQVGPRMKLGSGLTPAEQAILDILQSPAGLRALEPGVDVSTINNCALGGQAENLRLVVVGRPGQATIVTVASLARAEVALSLAKERLKNQGYFVAQCSKTQPNANALLAFIGEVATVSSLDKLGETHQALKKKLEVGHDQETNQLFWAQIVVILAAKHAVWKAQKAKGNNHERGGQGQRPASSGSRPGHQGGKRRRGEDRDEQ